MPQYGILRRQFTAGVGFVSLNTIIFTPKAPADKKKEIYVWDSLQWASILETRGSQKSYDFWHQNYCICNKIVVFGGA